MLPIERLFLAQVFDEEIADETAYYYSEDGANDLIFLPAADVRAALDGAKPDTSRLAQELLDEQRSEEHTSELQSLMRISYAVFCLKKKIHKSKITNQYNL